MGTRKHHKSKKSNKRFRKTRSKRQRGGDDATDLLKASAKGDTKEVERLLAKEGINVDTIDEHGVTPLLLASRYGHKEIVRKLLEAGADVNTIAAAQMTALTWATVDGHEDVVEILLQQPGIQINVPDMWGKTPLENASSIGNTEIVRMLLEARANIGMALIEGSEDSEIVKMLLEEGADVNEADIDGMTALMMASEHGHKDVVKILLEQEGINVNLWNNEGETALILASKNGHIEIVKMLLKEGAHVNVEEDEDAMDVEGDDYHSALMMASYEGHTEIVKILLAAGADINATANDGYDTAITLANRKNHDKIVELLIRKGATIPEDGTTWFHNYQKLRDKKEEILKQKTMAMEVMSRGLREDRQFRLLKHGQASVEMGKKVAEYLGGKRKTRKSKRKTRKSTRKKRKN